MFAKKEDKQKTPMPNSEKVALVSGGTRGIGLEITKALRADGFQVAALYRGNEDAARHCEEETGARALQCNVSDFSACQDLIEMIENDMGPIAIAVNNAGITCDGMLHKMDAECWHKVIDTNLNSCFNICRAVVPLMRSRKCGRIINISSINGQKGQMGQTNYSAAKAGMIGFTKALALENAAKGVTVNAICPGYIETEMTAAMRHDILETIVRQIPVGRMGKPEEIAAIVSFLSSEKAAFITGTTISSNGGQYMA